VPWVADPQRRNEDLREHLFKHGINTNLQKLDVDYKIIKGIGRRAFKKYNCNSLTKLFKA
jgi:hypothetical protein